MPDYSFPKQFRLLKSWEYQQAWKMGCKLHTPHFILLLSKNNQRCSRLGITVSRKVGNAVERNRVKRCIREFFRLNYDRFDHPVDLSVVAKKGASILSMEQMYRELERSFSSSGVGHA